LSADSSAPASPLHAPASRLRCLLAPLLPRATARHYSSLSSSMSPPGWSPQFKGTFLMSTEGDIIKEFQHNS
jgi:hypothetical protein